MPPISKWDAVVREIQHASGLPDDSFREARDGSLVVTGTGMNGDLTLAEREAVAGVAENRGFAMAPRDGAARVQDPRSHNGGGPFDIGRGP
jgi:hypothetical protein